MDLRNQTITVGELLDDPKSRAVFQRRFGKLMKHPMVGAARSLTLRQLAEIDKKTGVKTIKPSLEGVELGYDPAILMEEDLSLFGEQRADILEQFQMLMGDKAANE